mmetsp:Transcript_39897/g.71632  ORF Transcript_39897/g.71632 Transcript_39897/m.71632 type:complete len:211 (-) Transcript_39897:389-1021(-)
MWLARRARHLAALALRLFLIRSATWISSSWLRPLMRMPAERRVAAQGWLASSFGNWSTDAFAFPLDFSFRSCSLLLSPSVLCPDSPYISNDGLEAPLLFPFCSCFTVRVGGFGGSPAENDGTKVGSEPMLLAQPYCVSAMTGFMTGSEGAEKKTGASVVTGTCSFMDVKIAEASNSGMHVSSRKVQLRRAGSTAASGTEVSKLKAFAGCC